MRQFLADMDEAEKELECFDPRSPGPPGCDDELKFSDYYNTFRAYGCKSTRDLAAMKRDAANHQDSFSYSIINLLKKQLDGKGFPIPPPMVVARILEELEEELEKLQK
jgi:hypothetical protein